jgi:hypothetical protein
MLSAVILSELSYPAMPLGDNWHTSGSFTPVLSY